MCSKFQQNQFGRYSKGIGAFKFENFHYFEPHFLHFLTFSPFKI